MNQDRTAGQWKQLAGKIRQKRGKLTDDDLQRAAGNSEYLAGKIQERYGTLARTRRTNRYGSFTITCNKSFRQANDGNR